MQLLKVLPLILLLCGFGHAAQAASAKVIKVLPQFIDREGRHSVSPSLYDRDAYQAHLRLHPAERSGLRFAVQWKARGVRELVLRVEMRGTQNQQPTTARLEAPVKPRAFFSKWSALTLAGDDYKKFGELSAWRATLWDGENLLAEQRSFLW